MSIAEELVTNVIATTYAAIPKEAVARAKWRIIDTLGCMIAGANAPGCRGAVDMVRSWGGTGQSTIFSHGLRAPAHNAAMLNSLMARSFDFEPVEAEGETKSSPAHISGTTVPTAVTVAEWRGASGKDLLAALIVGDDLAARVAMATGFNFSLGWDNTGTVNCFGAAAIACRLMGLGQRETLHAFGIALNQAAGSMDGVWDKAMSFKLCMALASRTGIFSAELAARGFTGTKDPFLGRHGYFKLYCRDHDTSGLVKDLGRRFYADRVIKPHSACRATHSAIDAALKIARAQEINSDEVREIAVIVPPWIIDGFTGQPFAPAQAETPQIEGAFSIRYTVATALLRRAVKPAYFTDACLHDPAIHALIDRMKLIPLEPDRALAAEVKVTMADGRVLSGDTGFPRGDIARTPLSDEEIRAKFRDNVAYSRTVPTEKAEQALSRLEALEDVADVRAITSLFA